MIEPLALNDIQRLRRVSRNFQSLLDNSEIKYIQLQKYAQLYIEKPEGSVLIPQFLAKLIPAEATNAYIQLLHKCIQSDLETNSTGSRAPRRQHTRSKDRHTPGIPSIPGSILPPMTGSSRSVALDSQFQAALTQAESHLRQRMRWFPLLALVTGRHVDLALPAFTKLTESFPTTQAEIKRSVAQPLYELAQQLPEGLITKSHTNLRFFLSPLVALELVTILILNHAGEGVLDVLERAQTSHSLGNYQHVSNFAHLLALEYNLPELVGKIKAAYSLLATDRVHHCALAFGFSQAAEQTARGGDHDAAGATAPIVSSTVAPTTPNPQQPSTLLVDPTVACTKLFHDPHFLYVSPSTFETPIMAPRVYHHHQSNEDQSSDLDQSVIIATEWEK
ncbi:hypothetical protein H4R33_002182, partial [Dimargaris cristalligena]